ncbi:DsbA family protein [Desertibaculum subflavum]|uniref:DsbA family protein n=1 Tax=Desertibaculum subflavum TaxID=2268458 RepID=UPI000E66E5E3
MRWWLTAAAAILIGLGGTAIAQDALTPAQKEAVERLVREVIRTNPEIIMEALESHDQRQKQAEAQRFVDALGAQKHAIRSDPNSEVTGNPQGDVTVVEFFDYRCPYCKQAHTQLQALIKRDPKVRVVLKEFPILGPESLLASRAAIAARFQGKYLPLHTAMLETRALNEAVIFRLAADVGLDVERLKSDMSKPEVQAIIARNRKLAEMLGITGTPAFIIGDQLAPGALGVDRLAAMVEEARTACRTC